MFAGHRFVVAAAGLDDEDITLIQSQIVQHGGEMLGQEYTPQVEENHHHSFRLPRVGAHCSFSLPWTGASRGGSMWGLHCGLSGCSGWPSPSQCTHVLVVSNKTPEVERARADGRCVVTDYWLEACVKKGALQPTAIPGFEKLLYVSRSRLPLSGHCRVSRRRRA